jgi:hypothetical protein
MDNIVYMTMEGSLTHALIFIITQRQLKKN